MAEYRFNYTDGTHGSSAIQRDASGQVIYNPNGSVNEGVYGGWVGTDGKVTQGTPGGSAMSVMGYGNQYLPSTWVQDDTFVDPATVQPAANSGGATFGGRGVTTGNNGLAGQGGQGGSNPYLSQMGDVLTRQMTDNFNTRVLPQIGSQAMASGGYGGSRQGVIEANANNDLQRQIGSSLTNLYGSQYNTDRNYQLGMGNLGLGYAGLDRQINNDNLSWQLQGAQFGQGVQDRQLAQGQLGLGLGTGIQNAPMNYWQGFGNQYNATGQGYGTNTSTQTTPGNPIAGALGGAQLGGQIGNWWNSSSQKNPATSWFTGNQGMAD